ncbi:MAG: ATP-binding protein [Candidatus Nitrospinota bacterium M3_3B_026]
MRHSLQARLLIGLVLSLALVFTLQWLFFSGSIRRMVESHIVSRLEHDAETILTALQLMGAGAPGLEPEMIDPIYHRPFSGHYFTIVSAGGDFTLRSRSLWDQDMTLPSVEPGEAVISRVKGPEGQNLIARSTGYVKHGKRFTISVAEDVSGIESRISAFQTRYAIYFTAALAALAAAQWLIVRLSLKPLGEAREEVRRLERGEVENIGTDVPAEARPLVEEINSLLLVMSQRLRRSRGALGTLAHALKTPLSVISRIVEDERVVHRPEDRAALRENTRRIHGLIDRELSRARLAGAAPPGRRFSAAADIPDLIAALGRVYQAKGLDITWKVSAGFSPRADREDMMELLGNLLDNACKWASHKVILTAEERDGAFVFTVEDDGPGCPENKLPDVLKKGFRADESASGHGMGMAIASDIARGYGGGLSLGRSPKLGGFRVEAIIGGQGGIA